MQYVSFFTATILNWKPLLINDSYKDIIISSFRFLVKKDRIVVYAFVLMPNHMHIVWKISDALKREDVQMDFLKYTAHKIKFKISDEDPELLKQFYVAAKDRKYQFWERNPLTSRLPSIELVEQKINYIHANPIRGKWNLCNEFYEYKYSSAGFYYKSENTWDFLTHYADASID